jgi:hypothetical protein
VEGEPEAGAGPGRTSGGSDPRFVQIPVLGFAADKLQRARGVVDGPGDRGFDASGFGGRDKAVVDGDDRNTRLQISGQAIAVNGVFVAGIPSALNNEYLRVVGTIARLCSKTELIQKMLSATSPSAFIDILCSGETTL